MESKSNLSIEDSSQGSLRRSIPEESLGEKCSSKKAVLSQEELESSQGSHGSRRSTRIKPEESLAIKPIVFHGTPLSSQKEGLFSKKRSPEKIIVEKERENCSICLDKVNVDDKGELLCMHEFCFPCICEWSKQANKCPNCMAKFLKIKRTITNSMGKKEEFLEVEEKIYRVDEQEPSIHECTSTCSFMLNIQSSFVLGCLVCPYCNGMSPSPSFMMCCLCSNICHVACLPEPIFARMNLCGMCFGVILRPPNPDSNSLEAVQRPPENNEPRGIIIHRFSQVVDQPESRSESRTRSPRPVYEERRSGPTFSEYLHNLMSNPESSRNSEASRNSNSERPIPREQPNQNDRPSSSVPISRPSSSSENLPPGRVRILIGNSDTIMEHFVGFLTNLSVQLHQVQSAFRRESEDSSSSSSLNNQLSSAYFNRNPSAPQNQADLNQERDQGSSPFGNRNQREPRNAETGSNSPERSAAGSRGRRASQGPQTARNAANARRRRSVERTRETNDSHSWGYPIPPRRPNGNQNH